MGRTTLDWIVIADPTDPDRPLAVGRVVVGSRDPAAMTIVVK